MRRVRRKDTAEEMAVRRDVHRRGLRYYVDYQVSSQPRRVADIAFPRLKLAVFIDGCFWHGCPVHGSKPKENAGYWQEKIETNRRRDRDTTRRLREAGWHVMRFWGHESPNEVADKIENKVRELRANRT